MHTRIRRIFGRLYANGRRLFRWLRNPGAQHEEYSHFIDVNRRKRGRRLLPDFRQLRYVGRLLSAAEKRMVRIAGVVIAVALAAFLVLTYAVVWEEAPVRGGEYREALVGKPKFLNPVLAPANDVDLDIARLVYSGLMRFDPQDFLVPDLAASFDVSPDQKVYTFRLRQGVVWHDGEQFDADDVVFTVRVMQDPLVKSPLRLSLAGVKVEKVDEFTVRFTLPEPFAPFLSLLQFGILPEHRWFDIPPDQFALADINLTEPIGTGPYRVMSLVKDKRGGIRSYTLTAVEGHFRPAYLSSVVFKFYPSFEEAFDALNSGAVDGMSFLPPELRESIANKGSFTIYPLSLPQYTAIFYNQKRAAFLRDIRVRKALALAIDRERIVADILEGEGRVIDLPLLPGFPGHDPELGDVAFDAVKADALLAEAGWKRVDADTYRTAHPDLAPDEKILESYRKKGQEFLSIMLTTVDQPTNSRIAEAVQQAWEKLGVATRIELVSREQIAKATIDPRQYEALLYGEIVGIDPDPFPFWHSSQSEAPGLNLAAFENKHADKLLEEARATAKPDERAKKYVEFQKILAREVPAAFLFQPAYTYVVDRRIKGITIDRITQPSDRFARITEWYTKTKRRPKR